MLQSMTANITRRSFFSGASDRNDTVAVRPPGALMEQFEQRCVNCAICVETCPQEIIAKDQSGHAFVDFRLGACTFCGECAEVCPTGALGSNFVASWPWRASPTSACLSLNGISCRSCQDSCEVSAIRFRLQTGGRARPLVDEDTCIGCGACVAVCPVDALEMTSSDDQGFRS